MLQAPIDGQEREKDGDDKPNNGGARHRKLALAINRPCKSPLERSRRHRKSPTWAGGAKYGSTGIHNVRTAEESAAMGHGSIIHWRI
jgi:hypothetical protein